LDTTPVSASGLAKYYRIDGNKLQKQYKHHLSGFEDWDQLLHAEDWILFGQNLGSHVCIDEVALSQGELYTVITNGSAGCQQGSLIAMVKDTKSEEVIRILQKIPLKARKQVKEVTVDLAANMNKIGRTAFPQARLIMDRFHVQQLPSEALQQMRIKHRWEAIDKETEQIKLAKEQHKKYQPEVFENGDTPKQLLARSRYLLFKPKSKWTEKQLLRATILFEKYPDLEKGYELSMMLRGVYQNNTNIQMAKEHLERWYKKIDKYHFDAFVTAANSIKAHQEEILNYFFNRRTNALAENFNGKIKAFRATFRGIRDLPFFLYRVSLIFS